MGYQLADLNPAVHDKIGVGLRLANEAKSPDIWLASLRPTSGQRRLALAVAAVIVVGLGISMPFATTPATRINGFIPSLEAIPTDFIAAVLLFAQFTIYRLLALLALASDYLYTALIVFPHTLTFPGAFSPAGLLGAGIQSTAWLYIFWHLGLPTALIAYARLGKQKRNGDATQNFTAIRRWLERRACDLSGVCACVVGDGRS